METLKNPIVLGILGAVATYGYYYWDLKKRKENQMDLDESLQNESVSLTRPLIVGVVVWLLATIFLKKSNGGQCKAGNDNGDSDNSYSSNIISDISEEISVNYIAPNVPSVHAMPKTSIQSKPLRREEIFTNMWS